MSQIISPFIRYCMALGVVPSNYEDNLTVIECLNFLIKFLNDTVIPAFNENDEHVEEIKKQIEALQKYVDSYFDSLDIQTEVDHKLDQMASSGQLADIIAQYLGLAGVLAYNTIADMAAAKNLVNGSICRVLGNTNYATGDGSFYRVRTLINTDVVDGVNLVAITAAPTLVAERIHSLDTSKPINVLYYGVKADGVTDNTTLLQKIIDDNPRAVIYFPSGDYLIKGGLKVKHKYPVSFKLENDARLFTDVDITCLIDLGTERDNTDYFNVETDSYRTIIEGGVIDCNHCTYGVRTQSSASFLIMDGCRLINVDYYGIGIMKDSYYNSSNANLRNLVIYGKDSKSVNASTGIYLEGYDNKLFNITIQGVKVGININSAGNFINSVHAVTYFKDNTFTTAQFNATVAFDINGNDNTLKECYADTYGTGFFIRVRSNQTIDNCFTYWWQSPADSETYCVRFADDVYNPNATIVNSNFEVASNGTKHIIYMRNRENYNNLVLDNNHYDENADALDIAFDVVLNKNNNNLIPFATPPTPLTANSYYFIGYIKRDGFFTTSFDIGYAGFFKYSLDVIYVTDGVNFKSVKWYGTTLDAELVVADPVQIGNDYYAKLYLKTGNDPIWSQIGLSNVCGDLFVIPQHSKDTSATPTTTLGTFAFD